MFKARSRFEDHPEATEDEPVVLSYTQFRNHLGLLEWRRRLAQYEQGAAPSIGLRLPPKSAPAVAPR